MATFPDRTRLLALKEARRRFPGASVDDLDEEVDSILIEWAEDAANERELFGSPEDARCLDSCDDAGTGEGQFHGRI